MNAVLEDISKDYGVLTVPEIKQEQARLYRVDSRNDNEGTPTSLQDAELPAVVRQAAWALVEHHRQGHEVEIRARGGVESVLQSLSKQFLDFGATRVMAQKLAQVLVDEALDYASAFSSKVNQKYIAVSALVAEQFSRDMYQFETGHTEVLIVDKNSAEIAGAAGQEVRLTANGTATTSNRANMDDIFASAKKWALYIVHEAPGRQELDGVEAAQEAAFAAIAEGMADMPDIQELAAMIDQLEELGVLTPEIQEIVEKLAALQNMAAGEITAEIEGQISELSDDIMAVIQQAVEAGTISPTLLKGMVDFFEAVVETHGLQKIVDMTALSTVVREVSIAQLVEKLERAGADLSPEDRAQLEEMIANLHTAEGSDMVAQLAEIQELLEASDLPSSVLDVLDNIIQEISVSELSTISFDNMSLVEKIALLAEIGADDLMALVQQIAELDGALPVEIQDILDQVDIEALSVEEISAVLSGNGDPAIAEAVSQLVEQVRDPAVQGQLPSVVVKMVQQATTTRAIGNVIETTANNVEVESSAVDMTVDDGFVASKTTIDAGGKFIEAGSSSNVVSLPVDQPTTMAPIVQQLSSLQIAAVKPVVQGTPKSPVDKVINQNIVTAKAVVQKMADGGQVTGADINKALSNIDTALSKMPEGAEASQLQAVRAEIVNQTRDIDGIEPELQQGQGKGACPPPCTCCGDKFGKAAGQVGEMAAKLEILENGMVEFTPPQINPNGPAPKPIQFESQAAYEAHVQAKQALDSVVIKNTGFQPTEEQIKASVFDRIDNQESLTESFGHVCGVNCGCGEKNSIVQQDYDQSDLIADTSVSNDPPKVDVTQSKPVQGQDVPKIQDLVEETSFEARCPDCTFGGGCGECPRIASMLNGLAQGMQDGRDLPPSLKEKPKSSSPVLQN